MTSASPIFIIGRGIAGLSTALELLRVGRTVVVIGPANAENAGTQAAVGLSSTKGAILAGKPLFTLKKMGYDGLRNWLRRLEEETNLKIPQFWTGSTELFFDLTGYERIRNRVFHRKFTGAFRAERLGQEGLHRVGLRLGTNCGDAAGGFHYSGDGWFDPRRTLEVLEVAIRLRGGVFIDAVVERVIEAEPGVKLETSKGPLTAFDVIIAAGWFSDSILAKSIRYEVAQTIRQLPFGGDTFLGIDETLQDEQILVQFQKSTYVAFSGQRIFGSSCYRVPDSGPDADAARHEGLNGLIPKGFKLGLQKSTLTHSIWGLRGRAPDRQPLFGPLFLPSGNRRIWLVSGLYKNGLQLGPIFAREIARIFSLSNGPTELSSLFVPFRPTRFL